MIYNFSNPESMIKLAREIQTKVYWGDRFYLSIEENSVPYHDFWDVVKNHYDAGYSAVSIYDNDDVVFMKEEV